MLSIWIVLGCSAYECCEAQKTESSKGQKLAFQAKVEKKEKKMPVLVKKPRTEGAPEGATEGAETESTEEKLKFGDGEEKNEKTEGATDGAPGIGLAYSDSESEDN